MKEIYVTKETIKEVTEKGIISMPQSAVKLRLKDGDTVILIDSTNNKNIVYTEVVVWDNYIDFELAKPETKII